MIEQQDRQRISVLISDTYQKIDSFQDDMVTTTDVQNLLRQNEFGYHPLTEINNLLTEWDFVGKRIAPTNEMLWQVKMR